MNDENADCGVCLGEYDYEAPAFFLREQVKARKDHTCLECNRTILKGASYWRIKGKWDGQFDMFKVCNDCEDIGYGLSCDGSRMYGEMWTDVFDYVFPEMSFACVNKLKTASAKSFLVERYNEWSRRQ